MAAKPTSNRTSAPWPAAAQWGLLFLATLAAYWPALGAGFIWDDDGHVTRPGLRSLHGLWRIWFDLGATQQYYPLLHSAFWLEHRLWGDGPLGYHLLNVLLHATAACLFAAVLRRLWVPGAWIAALIFALHPVGVESVAWISEEKNTLSLIFYLLAALTYLKWRESEAGTGGPPVRGAPMGSPERTDGRAARPFLYLSATLFFVMALLSKSVTATLPAALLVVAWWQRGRVSWRRDFVPLLPWIVLGGASGLFTAWVERTYIGAHGAHFALNWGERCLLAGRVVCFYAGKLLWPADLIFVYPRWTVDGSAWWQYLFPLGVAAALAGAWLWRKRSRGPLAILLLFIGSLFPALGFVNVYPFVFSYVADHFQYLAELAPIAAAGAAAAILAGRLGKAGGRIVPAAVAAVAVVLGILTWRQSRTYRDQETFYRTILERNPACWLAQDNLGVVLANTGRLDEAMGHYETALRLDPDFAQTYNNFGNALALQHRWEEAFAAYAQAVRLLPSLVQADYDWGNALSDSGRLEQAIPHYEEALRLHPDYPEAEYRLGNALGNLGRLEEAMSHYREALRLRPDYAEAEAALGLALTMAGRLPEAIGELTETVGRHPGLAEARAYLGFALARSGRLPEAAEAYRAALRIDPHDADVHYQLGVVLRQLGRTAEAAEQFEEAEQR